MRARLVAIVAAVSVFMVVGIGSALATPPTVDEVMGDASADIMGEVMEAAVAILPYAATLMALFIGWRLVKRFIR